MEAKSIEITEPVSEQWFTTGVAVGAVMLLGLLFGMFQIFIMGHKTLASSNDVPWNIFIVTYAYTISSIGLSYIASFGIVLGIKAFDIISRRALFLALILITVAMLSIMADMGSPLNAIYLFLSPNLSSALSIVAISINLYFVLVALELYFLIKWGHDSTRLKFVAIATFVVAVVVHSFHGAIFGLTYTRDFWTGSYYPIYFLLSALYASSAIIILATVLTYKLTGKQISIKLEESLRVIGKMLAYLLAIAMFFLFWKMYTAYYAGKTEEAKLLITGPYKVNFWIFEVLVGFVIPFIMLTFSRLKTLNKMTIASLLVLVGLFFSRYDFIIVGQLIPPSAKLLSGLGVSDYLRVLSTYSPNITEIATVVGLLGVVWVAYILGVKYLSLDEDER